MKRFRGSTYFDHRVKEERDANVEDAFSERDVSLDLD